MYKKMKKILFVLTMLLITNATFALSCIEEYKPVCGNDGLTYTNGCYMLDYDEDSGAWVNSIGIAYQGECQNLNSCETFFDGCNICMVEDGKLTGCTKKACETLAEPFCMKEKELIFEATIPVFEGNIPSIMKEKVESIWSKIELIWAEKSNEQLLELYEALESKITEKVASMKDFQMRASFAPEAAKAYQQKLDMFEYLLFLIQVNHYDLLQHDE